MNNEEKLEKKLVKSNNKLNSTLKKAKSGLSKFIKNIKKIKVKKDILKYTIILIIAILIVIFIGKVIFNSSNKIIDYPVIFNTSEGDLYLFNSKVKKDDSPTKLAVGESVSNIVYSNTSERYVLFKKSSSLYLYDSKNNNESTEIVEKVKSYMFSKDDKYIITLDTEDNLQVYNYKTNTKIESDVSEIIGISEDKVLYEKEGVIYVRSIRPQKEDREKITAEYNSYITFSEDGKNVLYINKDNSLISYNVKKKKDNKIASNVKNYYCDKESCDKLFYITNEDIKSIYYYDGKKETKVAEGIYDIRTVDLENKQIVYTTIKDSKYSLHFQTVGKDASIIDEDLTSLRTVKIYKGKEIYYITGKNEVKYVKINNNEIDKPKSLGASVTGYLYLYKDGYAFVSDVDANSNGTLYLAKNGKAKKIDNNVNSSLITVNKTGDKLYYFKDYDIVGTLYVTSGSKNKKIDENVYTFAYINDNLLYYIKDYSSAKSRGDLMVYHKSKTTRLYEGVSRIASSPVIYK